MPDDPEASEQEQAAAASAALRRAARSAKGRPRSGRRPSAASGSRDPQPVGEALDEVVVEQGWQDRSSVAVLMAEWDRIVGADVAAHVEPAGFVDGGLVLQADSTAWATQMRLLLPQVQRAIDERLGRGVVDSISVRGPQAPSWSAGPRRVKGRGPRDTYG